MAPTLPSPILSVSLKEGARLLGISLNSIRRHAAAGRIRTVLLGRTTRPGGRSLGADPRPAVEGEAAYSAFWRASDTWGVLREALWLREGIARSASMWGCPADTLRLTPERIHGCFGEDVWEGGLCGSPKSANDLHPSPEIVQFAWILANLDVEGS